MANFSVAATAQGGDPDPVFATVPFQKWSQQGDHTAIPWKARILAAELDEQQRLRVTVNAFVEGKHLAKLAPGGRLLMLLQIADAAGNVYQGHGEMALPLDADQSRTDHLYIQSALVLPGDYRVTIAMLHTATGKYNLEKKTAHVEPLKNDPLPEAWQGLPPVEIIPAGDPPGLWFSPSLTGRMNLPLQTRRPVRLEVVMNLPPELASGEYFRECMAGLLPEMKVLSQIGVSDGGVGASLLDLPEQRAADVPVRGGALDWEQLRTFLLQADRNMIHAQSLANRGEEAAFLATEVQRRLAGGDEPTHPSHVVILLSAPSMVGKNAAWRRPDFEPNVNERLFLIRFHPPMERRVASSQSGTIHLPQMPDYDISGADISGIPRSQPRSRPPALQFPPPSIPGETMRLLEVIESFKPRVFDVNSPMQFREALEALLQEISTI